jgi:hypothetical protein
MLIIRESYLRLRAKGGDWSSTTFSSLLTSIVRTPNIFHISRILLFSLLQQYGATWTTTLPERPSLGQWESTDEYTQVISKKFPDENLSHQFSAVLRLRIRIRINLALLDP